MALKITTGDLVEEYVTLDHYWIRYGRVCGCISLLNPL